VRDYTGRLGRDAKSPRFQKLLERRDFARKYRLPDLGARWSQFRPALETVQVSIVFAERILHVRELTSQNESGLDRGWHAHSQLGRHPCAPQGVRAFTAKALLALSHPISSLVRASNSVPLRKCGRGLAVPHERTL